MLTTAMRKRAYARIDRQAARLGALSTGFIYNCAEWGPPEYMAMTAQQRYRSFGYGGNPVIEVCSFAFAQALAAALNAGKVPALHADYSARQKRAFVRSEAARRDFLVGRIARFSLRMERAKRTARSAGRSADRCAALRRALGAHRIINDARRTLARVYLAPPLAITSQGVRI